MTNLTAVKHFRYANRALVPGDDFMVKSRQDAKVLVAIGKAKVPAKTPLPEGLTDLRKQYEDIVGKRPFMGWGADGLREKIAAASDED